MSEVKVFCWDELVTDSPIPLIERRRVIGDKVMVSNVTLKTGCLVESHAHENEQIALVLSGRVSFGLGKEGSSEYSEVTLGAGEVLLLPPNVWHSARALEEAVIYDVFAPPSAMTGIDNQRR